MTKKKSILVGAAIAGLIAGSAVAKAPVSNNSGSQMTMSEKGQQAGEHNHKGQHACKGQNTCKGKGGCKSGDMGCKGKNTCKGKGGCATDGSHK